MNQPTLFVQLLHPGAKPPEYMSDGAGGMDFYAVTDGAASPGMVSVVPLGLSVAVPPGHSLLLTARSGHGMRFGAGVPQGYGLIDSDYRNEISMLFVVLRPMFWKAGDRICQGTIVATPRHRIEVVHHLEPTGRAGGFGSTGT